jgi:hypothetical protein
MAIGQQMAAGLGGVASGGATSVPAAAPQAEVDPYEQIEKLHKMMVAGAITQEEFDAKKTALLAKI